ncbi:chromosomal replication initiator protein DnaA [Philodulcilactobacillus myokoensis]|uniref:Chromosomal replication initiator protein DnaA n=1 Tax=Philodulcilactobacillus myokoensis TaxID=2929573 RepID=A0A9W6ERE5_9LACO|nr:chromosomal replication initiator protein DnaA [Philodulcilactobacillus myokoensis]GLB46100.1 chromosomal replication initiator protein DnaA [Philodulcilactobacillus myokoensis]
MDQNSLWNQIKEEFKNNVSQTTYSTWIKPVKPVSYSQNRLTLELPSPLHRDYWKAKLADQLVEYAYGITQKDINPDFVLKEEIKPKQETLELSSQKHQQKNHRKNHLNPDYTFDKFVIGRGNQMAHAAALVVSEDPGKMYNPLFFYGGVGLGKTHLMQAVGNKILKDKPKARVKYVTSETFTNDFINAIQTNHTEKFRKEYRNVDVLLVDDIQFFSNKGGTQEEFFHTFNDLYENGKQIVLTSDRLPNEVPKLQDRLVSRFAWGLSVDITAPDLETRIAILRSKAKYDNIQIPEDTLTFIAGQIDSNVRELEGALAKVQAFADLKKTNINTHIAAEAVKGLDDTDDAKKITIDKILSIVASYFNVGIEDMKGKKRYKAIVTPRQVAMYLSRELTDVSLPKIGYKFGGRDHTTVIHGYEKIKKAIRTNAEIKNDIADLKNELQK